jgi:hypothetical protein
VSVALAILICSLLSRSYTMGQWIGFHSFGHGRPQNLPG